MPAQSLGWSTLLGMGAVAAGELAAFVVLGLVVDALADTSPVGVLVGTLLGVIGAVGYTITKFRQYLSPSNGTTETDR